MNDPSPPKSQSNSESLDVEQEESVFSVLSSFSEIAIDKSLRDQVPIYLQVVQSIVSLIERGHLPHGTKLPTIRALADQLSVTRVTIHKAYHELQELGWVASTVGKGTYVSHQPPSRMEPIAGSVHGMTADKAMADISAVRQRQDTISLAMAEPDPRLYPGASFLRLFRSMESRAGELLRYGAYQGDPHLRQMLVGLLAGRGISAHFDDIIVTTGVTQGLSLCMALLCQPGDKVLVEEPTYLGYLSLLKSYQLEPIGVPLDEEGPCVKTLRLQLMQHRPRVFYTVPNFQNPSGIWMSEARRVEVLALMREHHVTVIEDDVYGDIRFDDLPVVPLRKLDEGVIYLNSFSKSLFPGLRIGYMLPPTGLKHELMTLIRCRSLCGPGLLQEAITEFLRRNGLKEHLAKVLPMYRERRDAMVEALSAYMPDGVQWASPSGGYSTWLKLPSEGAYGELYRKALERGVAFTPGAVFFSHPADATYLRLCFSLQEPPLIDTAVAILGRLVEECLSTPLYHMGPTPIV